RDAEAARLTREREDRGIVGSRFSAVPEPDIERPELPAGPLGRLLTPGGGEAQASGIGLARGAEPGQTIRGRLTAMLGGTDLPRMPEHVLQPEHYDPTRDVELQRAEARARALAEIEREFATPGEDKWETRESAEGLVQVNPRTGEVRRLGVQGPVRPGQESKPPVEAATNLRKEFQGLPAVKDAAEIAQNYARLKRISAQAAEDPTGAGDVAFIFSLMKMLDPGSVVREGEFANAEQAQGILQRVMVQYNKALRGERLTPETRAAFERVADTVAEGTRAGLRPVIDRYSSFAQQSGLDPVTVVYDPFEALQFGEEEEQQGDGLSLADRYSPDNPFAPGRSRRTPRTSSATPTSGRRSAARA